MVLFPNAKINLGLQIISKRPDNYHNIDSCFYPIGLCDVLEFVTADDFSFTSSGLPIPGNPEQNLCIQAYHMLCKDFALPTIKLHLHKVIPMGAGLGGGSSDAAFLLKGLNEVFQLGLSETILHLYSKRLGSDCAFFIKNKPTMASEKGDVFTTTDVNLNGKYIVIVYPNLHVSTSDAYAGVSPQSPTIPLDKILNLPLVEWKGTLKNDFEQSVFNKHPVLGEIKQKLYTLGAVYASMTGSGSSLFGIFDSDPSDLKAQFDPFFFYSGSLN